MFSYFISYFIFQTAVYEFPWLYFKNEQKFCGVHYMVNIFRAMQYLVQLLNSTIVVGN